MSEQGESGAVPVHPPFRMVRIQVLGLTLLLWEAVVRLLQVPGYLVPLPSDVFHSLIEGLILFRAVRQSFYPHLLITLTEVVSGFVIGSLLAILMAIVLRETPRLDRILSPYIIAFQSQPKIAIAPIVIMWLGVGVESKTVIAATASFFPVFSNSMFGLNSVHPELLDTAHSEQANRLQILRYVRFPMAMPHMVTGLEIAIGYSMIAAITGEFLGSTKGLGMLLLQRQFAADSAGVFSVLVVLAVVSVVISYAFASLRHQVASWIE